MLISFHQFINENSQGEFVLSTKTLKTFLDYKTWQPLSPAELESTEDPDAMYELEAAIRHHLSSNPSEVVELDTQWLDDETTSLDENSEWMKIGNFPELFYQAGDPEAHSIDAGWPIVREGIVRDEFLIGAKKLAEESQYPGFVFKWRGHTVVLGRSMEDVQEWLWMLKKDFIEEFLG